MLGGWKFLFLDGEKFTLDPNRPADWNRGAYLVNGPSHCAECHSPRNFLGGIIDTQRFAGGPELEGDDGWVPNITPAGIGKYSEADIVRVLKSGDTPDGDSVGGSMGKVVGNTSQLSDADRAAMATYVKSLAPVEGPKPPSK
jgi:mono/diheme cytochrome c family protein